jgi:hypothetical protein
MRSLQTDSLFASVRNPSELLRGIGVCLFAEFLCSLRPLLEAEL